MILLFQNTIYKVLIERKNATASFAEQLEFAE